MPDCAALYCRSSKDRSDVSIAAQERALRELAAARGLPVVEVFADAVESGKDDDRPGFQRLIRAVRTPTRGWNTLLVLDTARIGRRRLLALIFEEQECKRFGVKVIYKSLPEGDPLTDMLIKTVMQGFDEWHSLSSRAKGLAGMAENVRSGFRAGGRAPFGYRLAKVSTGAIRDGEPVSKSRLEVNPAQAEPLRAYFAMRATGVGRSSAARQARLKLSVSSLIGMEANALTYAGHTVWNVSGEKGSGVKRRPRSEWVIQRDTHPALITEEQAEALVEKTRSVASENSLQRRQRPSDALLGGLLVAPDGTPWHGDGDAYRLKRKGQPARTISRSLIESAVAEQIAGDIRSPRLMKGLAHQVQLSLSKLADDSLLLATRKQDAELARRIATFMDMAAEMTERGPALRKIEGLEKERVVVQRDLERLDAEAVEATGLTQVTDAQVALLLVSLAESLQAGDRASMRAALEGLIEKVELDPDTLQGRLHYRVEAGVKLASPRRGHLNPGIVPVRLRAVLPFIVVGGRRRLP